MNPVNYIFKFLGLVLLQVLILNHIEFLGFINPYLYVYFLLTLPSSINKDVTLLLGFLLGLCVDIFCGTLGCHAFATTLIAYLKPHLQKVFGPREDHDSVIPSFKTFGDQPFIQYVAILVLVHHFVFFLTETFTFVSIFRILLNTICSSIFTLLLIFIIEKTKSKK